MHTITIRLERTGQDHRHDLNPETVYLASCNGQKANDLTIPVDQATFDQYKEKVRYFNQDENSRQQGLDFFGKKMKEILDAVDLLDVEINRHPAEPLHLRLLIDPKELIQLPFELSLNPSGIQGQLPLLLNPNRVITLTREARKVGYYSYTWPVKPRILFAWASPNQSVPFEKHRDVLIGIVKKMVPPASGYPDPAPDIPALLSLLPKAGLAAINKEIKKGIAEGKPYTHVHILAHGSREESSVYPEEYKLTLHDDTDTTKPYYATGNELALSILEMEGTQTQYPAIVSLMVCDSGNTNDLTLPAGSVAHQLHDSGIPCVLASQFPLTTEGSVKLVEVLYEQLLLYGEDPRRALYQVRKALHKKDNHDWASLIAHVCFPDDMEEQLRDYKLVVLLEQMKVSTVWSDHILTHKDSIRPEKFETILDDVSNRLETSINRLTALYKEWGKERITEKQLAELTGLLGSAGKRKAEHLSRLAALRPGKKDQLTEEAKRSLVAACNWYRTGFEKVRRNHWTGIQYLSLTAVTTGSLATEGLSEDWVVVRSMARSDVKQDKDDADPMSTIWALGTLIECHLLQPLCVKPEEFSQSVQTQLAKATEYAQRMADAKSFYTGNLQLDTAALAFAMETTIRQLQRYVWWWPDLYKAHFRQEIKTMAETLIGILKTGI